MGLLSRLFGTQKRVNAAEVVSVLHNQKPPMLGQEIWTKHARANFCAGHDHDVSGIVSRAPYVSNDGKFILVDVEADGYTSRVILARLENGVWAKGGTHYFNKCPKHLRTTAHSKYYRAERTSS